MGRIIATRPLPSAVPPPVARPPCNIAHAPPYHVAIFNPQALCVSSKTLKKRKGTKRNAVAPPPSLFSLNFVPPLYITKALS